MPFFAQKSKVQYFVSSIKPLFQHFINNSRKQPKSESTVFALKCKKIFTLQNFTKFYVFRVVQHIDFQDLEIFSFVF